MAKYTSGELWSCSAACQRCMMATYTSGELSANNSSAACQRCIMAKYTSGELWSCSAACQRCMMAKYTSGELSALFTTILLYLTTLKTMCTFKINSPTNLQPSQINRSKRLHFSHLLEEVVFCTLKIVYLP